MLGYVVINKDQLPPEEFDVYRGYYCGVCKSMGKRFGQIPRMVLSYDSVFLAMLLASLEEGEDKVSRESCILHPFQKNPVIKNEDAIDYGADTLLMLAYLNFLDDKEDEHKLRGTLGAAALKNAFNKVSKEYPETFQAVDFALKKLAMLEKEKSGSIDITSAVFGEILGAVFAGYPKIKDGKTKRILQEIGNNLGKWIYLMDAIDDLEDDKKSGAYNPLIFRERGLEGLEAVLYNYLGNVSNGIDLLDIKKNKGIINNIVMLGLRGRTDGLLKKGKENGRSI